jgi:hypothetical protein
MKDLKDAVRIFRREVYRNLRYRDEVVYSVRKDGLVEGTALCVVLDGNTKYPVKFAVGPKGNQRVRDEGRKNVHAVIRGCIVNAVWRYDDMDEEELDHAFNCAQSLKHKQMNVLEGYEWKQITYDPKVYRNFVSFTHYKGDKVNPVALSTRVDPIYLARKVIIARECWAQVPVNNDNN